MLEKKKQKTVVPEIIVENGISEKKRNGNKRKVSAEEYEQQVKQVQVLAVLLADRIKKLSNNVVDEDAMSEDEYILQQKEIKELTTKEIMNTIKLLVDTDGFALDDSTRTLFSEFIMGNLIVNDERVPIETVRERREHIGRRIDS